MELSEDSLESREVSDSALSWRKRRMPRGREAIIAREGARTSALDGLTMATGWAMQKRRGNLHVVNFGWRPPEHLA